MSQCNYAYLDADGWVRQWSSAPRPNNLPDGSAGPYRASLVEGLTLDLLPEGFETKQYLRKVNGAYTDMSPPDPAPSPTCEVRQSGEVLVWVETLTLVEAIANAISQIDGAADAARLEVLSRQTNTVEYQRAEQQARAFKASGYPSDDVPGPVASWAKAKYRDGWTARQAADDIIATADSWYALLDAIRDLRLCAKEDVRHASSNDDVSTRVKQFSSDLYDLMKGVS